MSGLLNNHVKCSIYGYPFTFKLPWSFARHTWMSLFPSYEDKGERTISPIQLREREWSYIKLSSPRNQISIFKDLAMRERVDGPSQQDWIVSIPKDYKYFPTRCKEQSTNGLGSLW